MSKEYNQNLKPVISWRDYKVDPRYFILLFLFTFVCAGQLFLGFFQQWDAVFVSVTTTVLTEFIIVRVIYKKFAFPLSAFITGLGVSLLLSSHVLAIYVLTSFLAIVLKFTIRFKGGHVFNPNNLAMVVVLFLLPAYAVSTPKQWTNGFTVMALVLCLGVIACYMAKRLDIVVSYLTGFVIFALMRHYAFGAPLWAALGPLMGASLQLFSFFMITDPKSTPTTRKARIIFGLSVALIDAIFRIYNIPNSQFYALFTIAALSIIPFRLWATKNNM
ncbi:RnfABCDGE type electron transport complex subunit D [Bacillus sp. 166amftsu]|uniref:RnfABCDGE type electron transport complex subunit D n=1 Tax=Bacillus sp. 166amftsu TaxID=1761753 RepID=UPI0008985D9F|nr:RnfABCDGE type electron transport complex subunit D [Bacillus sp. 166amftsu]SDZ40557.1 NQR2, RnfD, RnfE family [Bacillus sp. 166amftsu]